MDEDGFGGVDGDGGGGPGDRHCVGDLGPGSAVDAEVAGEGGVDPGLVGAWCGVGVGDVAGGPYAAVAVGGAEGGAVAEDVGVVVDSGSDLDGEAKHGGGVEGVDLAGFVAGCGPRNAGIGGQADEGRVALGLGGDGGGGPGGEVEGVDDLGEADGGGGAGDLVGEAGGAEVSPGFGAALGAGVDFVEEADADDARA